MATPLGLTAVARPAGAVALAWKPVDGAVDYVLYRQAPGESALTALGRTGVAAQWSDRTQVDGPYRYAVASIRVANTQEAESAQSEPVDVVADSQAPLAPAALALQLSPIGVQAQWTAPQDEGKLLYRLYRGSSSPIVSVEGLTSVRSGIAEPSATDPYPRAGEPYYVVTASDGAGNESPPSNTAYLNAELVPVATLSVEASIVVGGHADLADLQPYSATVELAPHEGEFAIPFRSVGCVD